MWHPQRLSSPAAYCLAMCAIGLGWWNTLAAPEQVKTTQPSITPIELLPAEVEGVFQVRGLDGFRQRLHVFLRETVPAGADMIRRTLDEQVRAFLENRRREELDGERPIFLAVLRWQDWAQLPPPVVIGLPVRNREKFLQSFLLPAERKELREHLPGCQRTVIAAQEVFIVQRDTYLLLTPQERYVKLLLALAQPTPPASLSHQLTPVETQRWSQADVAIYLKPSALVALVASDIQAERKSLEAAKDSPFGYTALAWGSALLDLLESGRDLQHCLITGRIEKDGVRIWVGARARPDSQLARLFSQARLITVADVDRLPEGLHHYGTLQTDITLEPLLRRYHQVIQQAAKRLPVASAQTEQLLAEIAGQLIESQPRRVVWAFDTQGRGLLILEVAKPTIARRALVSGLDALARQVSSEGVIFRVQSEAGQLLELPAARVELQIAWKHVLGTHEDLQDFEAAMLRHLLGHQWTLWLVADEGRVYIVSSRDRQEAERWLKNYRQGTVEHVGLRRHRQALGESLSGLAMLQFNALWRHFLEGLDKAAATQGFGNLIPKDAFPDPRVSFFSLGVRVQRDGLELELWAPKESVSDLNPLFIFAVHGLF